MNIIWAGIQINVNYTQLKATQACCYVLSDAKEDSVHQKCDLLNEKLYQNSKNKKIPNSKLISELYITLKP